MIAMPDPTAHERRLETSYTVQLGSLEKNLNETIRLIFFLLGAQLKSMYNLRLIRCDMLDYCRLKTTKKE